MQVSEERNSRIIDGMTFGFSTALLLSALAGAAYTGTFSTLLQDFARILTSPGPLVTDYFLIGSMPAAFLNLFQHRCSVYCAAKKESELSYGKISGGEKQR